MLPVPHPRSSLLARSVRVVGLRAIRADLARFSELLERVIDDEADAIRRDHRFEDFLDEAVRFALSNYDGLLCDRALLIVARQTERLMQRIFSEACWTSFLEAEDIESFPFTR
jgi:hypothetical protein